MSETEHVKGRLTEVTEGKENIIEKINSYDEDYYGNFIVYDNSVYMIHKQTVDPYDDICEATPNEDGSINFEVRFYNGGSHIIEMITNALDKLKD